MEIPKILIDQIKERQVVLFLGVGNNPKGAKSNKGGSP
jgi:hypothetical protein